MSALDELKKKEIRTDLEAAVLSSAYYEAQATSFSGKSQTIYSEKAAKELLGKDADLAALNARVEEMKTDLARCFIELSECGSESFADDMAVKYFSTWQEIQKRAKGAE